ncbi:MAG: hypothetical protein GFH27_549311n70 [Chloroflexi bacterium AL-W]|nr:hypothetical protein [Chloroflexi bacterium AL-N1]NOK68752.1 hypothetical protein [Chloroflexi bacterium AL-N10]NOK76238.1 hypothetical protein [Chloroflexi bacterium AL-N5]NOK84125.1 hypothetical protein [Chloroflexi bacterium AL-W]NOK91376.1 hypothetical protein [Chloroflexi bacterium AL-N15]
MAEDQPFGSYLKILRRHRDLTQEQLAEAVGLSVETIKSYERKQNRLRPSQETTQRMAKVLGLLPDTREFDEFTTKARKDQIINSPSVSKSNSPQRTRRKRLLWKVRSYWIERVLEPSLRDLPPIGLNCVYQPGAIYPWEAVLEPSESTSASLVSTTSITYFFDNSHGELLITGAPGAGKTTLLLQLAQVLLSRAEHHDHLPIPVIFKLSSWSEQCLPLAEWLVEELQHRYDVPPSLGKEWVAENQLVLLFDGLDEVVAHSQVACVQAITHFRRQHLVDLVLTCRQTDYEELQTSFNVQGVVTLQPLTSDGITTYLTEAGVRFSPLQQALQTDDDLAEIVTSPLMLHLIMTVFQSTSDTSMSFDTSLHDYRHQLITQYTEHMLKRRGVSQQYTSQQTQHWLIWLSSVLQHQSRNVFSIAQLQPHWLSPHLRRVYTLLDRMLGFVLVGLVLGLGYAAIVGGYGLIHNMGPHYFINFWHDIVVMMISGGVIGGFFGGNASHDVRVQHRFWYQVQHAIIGAVGGSVILGLVGWLTTQSIPGAIMASTTGASAGVLAGAPTFRPRLVQGVDPYRWSWRRALRMLPGGLIAGFLLGTLSGLVIGKIDGVLGAIFGSVMASIMAGILVGLLTCTILGLTYDEVELQHFKRTRIIDRSFRRAIWTSGGGGLVGSIYGVLVASGPITWLLCALTGAVISAWTFGGCTLLSHGVLRFILWRCGFIPWNYTQFLDFCAARLLLRKVGDGYLFAHEVLQEHFATIPATHLLSREAWPVVDSAYSKSPVWVDSLGLIILFGVTAIALGLMAPAPVAEPIYALDRTTVVINTGNDYNGSVMTNISVAAGQQVTLLARGKISIGPFTEYVDAQGVERGFLGIPLGNVYKHVVEFPTGALLCKISTEVTWRYCGIQSEFVAPSSGHLEFLINDNDIHSHEGKLVISVQLTNSTFHK